MNREIKFRGWDKRDLTMKDVASIWFKFTEGSDWISLVDDERGLTKSEDVVLVQYTGLVDKNGVDIFEDDIVRISDETQDNVFIVSFGKHVADWHTGEDDGAITSLGFYLKNRHGDSEVFVNNLLDDIDKVEVVGNIYENPELIEK